MSTITVIVDGIRFEIKVPDNADAGAISVQRDIARRLREASVSRELRFFDKRFRSPSFVKNILSNINSANTSVIINLIADINANAAFDPAKSFSENDYFQSGLLVEGRTELFLATVGRMEH